MVRFCACFLLLFVIASAVMASPPPADQIAQDAAARPVQTRHQEVLGSRVRFRAFLIREHSRTKDPKAQEAIRQLLASPKKLAHACESLEGEYRGEFRAQVGGPAQDFLAWLAANREDVIALVKLLIDLFSDDAQTAISPHDAVASLDEQGVFFTSHVENYLPASPASPACANGSCAAPARSCGPSACGSGGDACGSARLLGRRAAAGWPVASRAGAGLRRVGLVFRAPLRSLRGCGCR